MTDVILDLDKVGEILLRSTVRVMEEDGVGLVCLVQVDVAKLKEI